MFAALPIAWVLPAPAPGQVRRTTSFTQDVVTGFRVIVTNRALFRVTLVSVISCIGYGGIWVIGPLLGKEVFGNAGYGGVLMSVMSLGALAATTVYGRWPPRYGPDRVIFITTLLFAASILLLAFTRSAAGTLTAMLLAGIADGPQLAATFEVRHRESPERSRSQVFTTAASLKITACAIGAALAGQLAGSSLGTPILAA